MKEIGIRKTHNNLKKKLMDYIEAQYFAENDILTNVADKLFEKKEVLYQEPYIEITKNYKMLSNGFDDANLSIQHKKILDKLIEEKLGVFKTPFSHQVEALEKYYSGENILVTTGTGSGKTECFLWPILTDLIYESNYSKQTWEQEGIRALVLYPMNALVSDQLGRLRKIIGREDDAFYRIQSKEGVNRRARFGMYTGRTPYAGKNDCDANKRLAKIMKKSYLDTKASEELKKIGRIPSKDMNSFINNLKNGLQITNEKDSELYTRYEMQMVCPDILITNYSMLEYMLMRPIEDSFWNKTIKWLNMSDENKLLLVIDEAHMYRGASGGEVSLLIRRLMDRLHMDSSKLKCILTSASVPNDKDKELQEFACSLTGSNEDKGFSVIREVINPIQGNKKANDSIAKFYSDFSLDNLQGDFDRQLIELKKLKNKFNIDNLPNNSEEVSQWLYDILKDNSTIKEIVKICNNGAKSFSSIRKELFSSDEFREANEKALEIILQLGTMAKSKDGRVLLGTKVHMMFKGIQGLYACINPNCSHKNSGMGINLGYISNEMKEKCPHCESRMFELMMDRKCGTLYLKAFIDKEDEGNEFDFLWSSRNSIVKHLEEMHLWIVPENRNSNKKRSKVRDKSEICYLQVETGLLFRDESHSKEEGFIKVIIPKLYSEINEAKSFDTCPNCEKDFNKITPFNVRGNEPFANIVRELFDSQQSKDKSLINEGKKVLLFSDSRQRAATLARDLTIASDGDAGRQAIFMAQKLLDESNDDDKTLDLLYYAFLKVVCDNDLNFFYGKEKELFKNHIKTYRARFGGKDISKFERVRKKIGDPPEMFYQLLLKNISNSYRSFNNLGLGQIVLAERGDEGDDIESDLLDPVSYSNGLEVEDIRLIYNTWIQYLIVRKIAIFPNVDDDVRNSILAYDRGGFGITQGAKFPTYIMNIFENENITEEQIKPLIDKFNLVTEILTSSSRGHNRQYIKGEQLELKTAENSNWYKCDKCSGMSTYTLWGHCIYCGSKEFIRKVDKEHLNRYSLWRNPVINAINGEQIKTINTAEHTAQLSYKDITKDAWVTTEKSELAFRDIVIEEDKTPIDVLSCTTTMEVGIDIGSLTSIGLRNVPPMRENYQQRAGRAGRAGAAVSSIVTYTENGPHDSWYFKYPDKIISGIPRTPWIDSNNKKLIKRHVTLILLQEYFRIKNLGLDEIYTINFFDDNNDLNYEKFLKWLKSEDHVSEKRKEVLIPKNNFEWSEFTVYVTNIINKIKKKVDDAPFIYTPVNDEEKDKSKSNTYHLIDVLFSEGVLPNYSFPRNIVNFWIEDTNGKLKESPERSIDIALSEYAPGRALVVDKQTYISGGIFNYYTKLKKGVGIKAAKPWLELDEYNKVLYYCTNELCGWFGLDGKHKKCPLCGSKIESHTMIKPWGFAAMEAKSIPETHNDQEYSYVSEPSYSSMPSGEKMSRISEYIRIENRENQKLILVNKGPEDKGFELCGDCGAIEPNITNGKERERRKRPYRLLYKKDDMMKCRHSYSNVYLGNELNTDMMVMEIKLDREILDMSVDYKLWLIPALTSFAEGVALAASRELDVEFSDIKSGYRIRHVADEIYADVYLYDSLSSGAGYALRVSEFIESVLDKMSDIFEDCTCDSSCPNCLEHFWNQKNKEKLDRKLASDFINFIRYGKLREMVNKKEKEYYIYQLNKIASMHGKGEVIKEKMGKYFYEGKNSSVEIIIYPSMCNIKNIESYNTIYLSDRECRFAISEVWRKLTNV